MAKTPEDRLETVESQLQQLTERQDRSEARISNLEDSSAVGCLTLAGKGVPAKTKSEVPFTILATLAREMFKVHLTPEMIVECRRYGTHPRSPIFARFASHHSCSAFYSVTDPGKSAQATCKKWGVYWNKYQNEKDLKIKKIGAALAKAQYIRGAIVNKNHRTCFIMKTGDAPQVVTSAAKIRKMFVGHPDFEQVTRIIRDPYGTTEAPQPPPEAPNVAEAGGLNNMDI